jgi:uncharacterized SAM-binding protein YcdF (DUF218 family)
VFFEVSKIAWAVLEPLNLITLLLAGSCSLVWGGRIRTGKYLLTGAVIVLLAVTIFPVGDALLVPLEQRFRSPQRLPARVDGIILLGGAQVPPLTKHYGEPAMNGAAETMTTFLALARKYPDARLVFSGGSGDVLNQGVSEAETIKLFLAQQGFEVSRVTYETSSRNTYENVILSKELVQPRPGEEWVLVTSASRMPRSVGVFRKAAWQVTPVPCDFNAVPQPRSFQRLSVSDALFPLNLALREWIGLAVYFVTGKTDVLFPAPS